MEMRTAEPIWEADGTEGSLVERLEAQVGALTRKVARLERRQQRFTDMIRLLLALHDQTVARLTLLDGGVTPESLELMDEVSRGAPPLARRARSRRTTIRRTDG